MANKSIMSSFRLAGNLLSSYIEQSTYQSLKRLNKNSVNASLQLMEVNMDGWMSKNQSVEAAA